MRNYLLFESEGSYLCNHSEKKINNPSDSSVHFRLDSSHISVSFIWLYIWKFTASAVQFMFNKEWNSLTREIHFKIEFASKFMATEYGTSCHSFSLFTMQFNLLYALTSYCFFFFFKVLYLEDLATWRCIMQTGFISSQNTITAVPCLSFLFWFVCLFNRIFLLIYFWTFAYLRLNVDKTMQ